MNAPTDLIIRNSTELADALAAAKNFRGLSNEGLEELIGLTRGHIDKMLGPSREKNIGARSLDYMLAALGFRLRLELDPEQEALMRSRWEKRNSKQIRVNASRPSTDLLKRAAAALFADLGRKGNIARMQKLSAERRSFIARKAARAKWKKLKGVKRNGQSGIRNLARKATRNSDHAKV